MLHRATSKLFALAFTVGLAQISNAYAQETVKIGMAVPNNTFYAPIYAAQELGYLRDQGIKAEITDYRGGAAAQQALSVGAADLTTYFGGGVALAIDKGAKEKIVATIDAAPYAWHLIVNAKSPFHSVKDLAGKKIGITTKASTSDVLVLWAAKRAGITIQEVPVGSSGELPMLKSGQVDAIAIPPLQSLQLLADGSGRSLIDYGREMEPNLPDVWVASQDMIDHHPDTVRKTLTAFYKALDYMRKNRPWALAYLKKITKSDDDRVVGLAYDQGTLVQSADGAIDKAWVKNALDLGVAMGMSDLKSMKSEDIFTTKFAPVEH